MVGDHAPGAGLICGAGERRLEVDGEGHGWREGCRVGGCGWVSLIRFPVGRDVVPVSLFERRPLILWANAVPP